MRTELGAITSQSSRAIFVPLVCRRGFSKQPLDLNPQRSYASVSIASVQEFPRGRVHDVHRRHLHILRMIEGVLRFAPKFHVPAIACPERLKEARIEVV